jgi:hypothetical protein
VVQIHSPDHSFTNQRLATHENPKSGWSEARRSIVEIHLPDHLSLLNQTHAAVSKTGSDLIFGPFGPTASFLDGSSKPKPILSATSLQNSTSCRILLFESDIARRPSIPALSEWNGDAAEGRGTLRIMAEITIRQPQLPPTRKSMAPC